MLTADGDLEDKLSDAMNDEWPMVALKLASWADVDALADYQYMLRKPLCLICDDAELLEAGLRAYQGRALYEGNLTEDALAPLVENTVCWCKRKKNGTEMNISVPFSI